MRHGLGSPGRIAGLAAIALAFVAVSCRPSSPPRAAPSPPAPAPPALPPQPPIVNPSPRPTLAVSQTFASAASPSRPWDIAFDPTGTAHDLVFTENNTGKVRSFFAGAATGHDLGTMVAIGSPLYNTGEAGLMGLAFNPSGTSLYVCVSTNVDNRVVRFTVDARDGSGHLTTISAPTPILTGMNKADFHDGCRLRFQPNTSPPALSVTMGDAGGGPNPQNPGSLNGKILRITESGAAYSGNASGTLWYSKGHRNPQGVTFHPTSNQPYTAEHGPDRDDEVNALVNGGNAGWDPNTGGSYDQSHPMTDLARFPDAVIPLWRSGSPSSAVTFAPSGLTFVVNSGANNWRSWSGSLIVAFLKNSELRVLFVDASGAVTGQHVVPESQLGQRLRVAVQGPDGALYVATDEDPGAIWKITAA